MISSALDYVQGSMMTLVPMHRSASQLVENYGQILLLPQTRSSLHSPFLRIFQILRHTP